MKIQIRDIRCMIDRRRENRELTMSRTMSSEEKMSGVFLLQKSEVLCKVLLKSIGTVSISMYLFFYSKLITLHTSVELRALDFPSKFFIA